MVLIHDRIIIIDICNFEMSYKTPEKSLKSNQIYSVCLVTILDKVFRRLRIDNMSNNIGNLLHGRRGSQHFYSRLTCGLADKSPLMLSPKIIPASPLGHLYRKTVSTRFPPVPVRVALRRLVLPINTIMVH